MVEEGDKSTFKLTKLSGKGLPRFFELLIKKPVMIRTEGKNGERAIFKNSQRG
jgi:hypothetical protein